MADRDEFDVLGIYMSERLGRIADETPLIVSYLNARGKRVVSYTEGEISTKTHADKLMTYIRYWQAEGESLKTSIRIKDAYAQSVKQGKWRGGRPPYGYCALSRGTLNFKGRPIFDIEPDPETSEVVKTIFRLYGKEKYGGKMIAQILNDKEIPTQEGNLWRCSTITSILRNRLYTGVYVLGKKSKSKLLSPVMEKLKIIDESDFNEVQELLKANALYPNSYRPTRRGTLLLTGILYCGDCGKKYTSQRNTYKNQRANGHVWQHERITYRCGSYLTPKKDKPNCDRRILTAERVEALVAFDAKSFLSEFDKDKLLTSFEDQMREQEKEVEDHLRKIARNLEQKEKEVQRLKDEVVKVLMGESQFEHGLLTEMINTKQAEIIELGTKRIEAQSAVDATINAIAMRRSVADEIQSWHERFDTQDTMTKKSMLIKIIDSITVYAEKADVVYSIKFDILGDDGMEFDEDGDTELTNDTDCAILSAWCVKRTALSTSASHGAYPRSRH